MHHFKAFWLGSAIKPFVELSLVLSWSANSPAFCLAKLKILQLAVGSGFFLALESKTHPAEITKLGSRQFS